MHYKSFQSDNFSDNFVETPPLTMFPLSLGVVKIFGVVLKLNYVWKTAEQRAANHDITLISSFLSRGDLTSTDLTQRQRP